MHMYSFGFYDSSVNCQKVTTISIFWGLIWWARSEKDNKVFLFTINVPFYQFVKHIRTKKSYWEVFKRKNIL